MAVALKTAPESAISRYDQLVAAIRRRLDDANYDETAIAQAITLAEAHIRREMPMAANSVDVAVTITGLDPGTSGTDYIEVGAIVGPVYPYLKPLTSVSPVNWLIERHPDIYFAGTLYYVYLDDRNGEGAAMALSALNVLLSSGRRTEILSQYGSGPLIPTGFGQVRGARA